MIYEIDGMNIEIHTPACVLSELTSLHGLLRAIERTGMNEPQALRMIRNAWIRGTAAQELPFAWQRSRLVRFSSITAEGPTLLRVYRDCLFIFSQSGVLITMIPLPAGFFRKHIYDGEKKPVRNIRRYIRMNGDSDALCA